MDILEKYIQLAAEKKWNEALPVIIEIIEMDPEINTSWFNYGVCLEALDKHAQAAGAFQQAYLQTKFELNGNEEELGHYAEFRMCCSLYQADMLNELFNVFQKMLKKDRHSLEPYLEIKEFQTLFTQEPFSILVSKGS